MAKVTVELTDEEKEADAMETAGEIIDAKANDDAAGRREREKKTKKKHM